MKLILSLMFLFGFCDFVHANQMANKGTSKVQKDNKLPQMLQLAVARLNSVNFQVEPIIKKEINVEDFKAYQWTLKPKQKTSLEVYVYLVDYFDGIKLAKTFDPKWKTATNGDSLLVIKNIDASNEVLVTSLISAFSGEE